MARLPKKDTYFGMEGVPFYLVGLVFESFPCTVLGDISRCKENMKCMHINAYMCNIYMRNPWSILKTFLEPTCKLDVL